MAAKNNWQMEEKCPLAQDPRSGAEQREIKLNVNGRGRE